MFPILNDYLYDFRTSTPSGTGAAYFSSGTTIGLVGAGTRYVDGVASSIVSINTKEIIITGIPVSGKKVSVKQIKALEAELLSYQAIVNQFKVPRYF